MRPSQPGFQQLLPCYPRTLCSTACIRPYAVEVSGGTMACRVGLVGRCVFECLSNSNQQQAQQGCVAAAAASEAASEAAASEAASEAGVAAEEDSPMLRPAAPPCCVDTCLSRACCSLLPVNQPLPHLEPPLQGPKRMRIHVVPRSSGSSGSGDEGSSLPPAPGNPDVTLSIAGGEVVAARQFEGNATQEACERCRQALVAALQRDGLALAEAEAGGYFRLAQYGPLHSLQTRVNEVRPSARL